MTILSIGSALYKALDAAKELEEKYGLSTEVIDATFVKYYLNMSGTGGGQACEVNLFNLQDAPQDTVFNKIGLLNISITGKLVTGKLFIEITNNELFTLTVVNTYMNN